MNDKLIIKKIHKLLDELTPLFCLQSYDKAVTIKEDDNNSWVASVSIDDVYKTINVDIYPLFFKESPQKQRRAILHELSHTITTCNFYDALDILKGKFITARHLEDEMERANCMLEYILDLLLIGDGAEFKKAYKEYLSYGSIKKQNKKRKR